jgi:branched-chain amino acid transport system ATP-binding protein
MTAPMIEIEDIHTYYGHSYILQGVSLHVAPGEIVAVLGRNGVGKTTLIRSIIGFTPPQRGRIRFRSVGIEGLPPEKIARLGISLVPQARRVFRSLTVSETLSIASRSKGSSAALAGWFSERVYQAFPRLRERRDHRAGNLSGGEQQMLATGRALVSNPALILLDEPTEGLSPLLVRELQAVLRQLRADGTTLLLVEQRINFAIALADRIYLMIKGQIAHETTPDLLRTDADLRQRFLGV